MYMYIYILSYYIWRLKIFDFLKIKRSIKISFKMIRLY